MYIVPRTVLIVIEKIETHLRDGSTIYNSSRTAYKRKLWKLENMDEELLVGQRTLGYCGCEIDTAKGAWDHLAFMNRQPFSENPPQAPVPSSYPQGQNGDENTWRSVLYKAMVEDDWERTKNLLDSHPEGRSTRLSKGETILHTAVLCNHVQLVEEIVNLMSIEELEAPLPYRDGATALHLAASGGVVKIAEPMVNKNRNLLCLKDNSDYLPVALAYAKGQKNMTKYLFSVIGVEELNLDRSHSGATMLTTAIMSQDYDFALEIHDRCPQLTTMPNVNRATALETLAVMASAFPSGSQLRFWQKWIYNCINLQPTDAGNSEDSILT
ncbi:hypothetical protein F0562_015380 [Nyssa sinensis]|uniref:Uncharacterized protein n=1 Tax=Nyssa sinensis TaxID=561372 RepID=A0A5J4ZK17_9ASTE|nr:hypothetical protein F0562_015380 [Nyssa sinensis]